ncbi:MAG: cation diffusion facilitator family transporter [Candidatus Hodarchaeota archaeon]
MAEDKGKDKIANFAVIYTFCVLSIKIVVVILSNSLSVVSETTDVVIDIVLLILLKYSIKKSNEPPDARHTYGHGKYETLFSIIQGIIIVIIYTLIINNAIQALTAQESLEIGSMLFTTIVFIILIASNLIIGSLLVLKSKDYESESLKMQGINYFFDGLRAAMVIIALLLYSLGVNFADPLFAIIISITVIFVSFYSSRDAYQNLLEKNPLEQEEIIKILQVPGNIEDVDGIQDIRVQRVGDLVFIIATIMMDEDFTLKYAHKKTEEVEQFIRKSFPDRKLEIVLHVHSF